MELFWTWNAPRVDRRRWKGRNCWPSEAIVSYLSPLPSQSFPMTFLISILVLFISLFSTLTLGLANLMIDLGLCRVECEMGLKASSMSRSYSCKMNVSFRADRLDELCWWTMWFLSIGHVICFLNVKVSFIRPGLQGYDEVSIFTRLIFGTKSLPSTQTKNKPNNNETKQKLPNILSFRRDLKHGLMNVYQSWLHGIWFKTERDFITVNIISAIFPLRLYYSFCLLL